MTILGAVGSGTDSTEPQTSKFEAMTCTMKKKKEGKIRPLHKFFTSKPKKEKGKQK